MMITPDNLPNDVATLKAMVLAGRAENNRLAHEEQVLTAEVLRLEARNARLDHIVSVLRRARFGRRSEKQISDNQIELALEDIETDHGIEDAKAEKGDAIVRREGVKNRRANRGHLPKHLPREEVVIEPDNKNCLCCGGALHVIGEDASERLDAPINEVEAEFIPAGDAVTDICGDYS